MPLLMSYRLLELSIFEK